MTNRPTMPAGMLRHPCPRTPRGSGIVGAMLTLALVLLWAGAGWGASDSIGYFSTCGASLLTTANQVRWYYDVINSDSRTTIPAQTGTWDSIRACIKVVDNLGSSNQTAQFRAAIYKGHPLDFDPVFIDSTAEISFTTYIGESKDTNVWLSFVGHAAAMKDTLYQLCLWGRIVTGYTVSIKYDATTNDTLLTTARTYTGAAQNWPASMSGTPTNSRELSLVAYYTVTASGSGRPHRDANLWKDSVRPYFWPHLAGRFAGGLDDEITR